MTIKPWVVENIVFPVADKARGRCTRSAIRELRHNTTLSREQLNELRAARLSAILDHALLFSPFYAPRIPADGGDPWERLRCVPVLTKDEVRGNFDQLLSEDASSRSWHVASTGGSTGVPTRFGQDEIKMSYMRAAMERFFEWAGYRWGEPQLALSGSSFDASFSDSALGRLKQYALGVHPVSAFQVSDEYYEQWYREALKVRPQMIRGYASLVHGFADFLRRTGREVYIPVTVTSSETLHPSWRPTIERQFNSTLYDNYSSREFAIAAQCQEGRYHIADDIVHVEVLDEDGDQCEPGSAGRVVITDFFNYAFPLIRYEIGDNASLSSEHCPCGRPHALMGEVEGRSDDNITLPDGRTLSSVFFPHLVKDAEGIAEFQVAQVAVDQIELRLVPDSARADRVNADIEYVRRHVQEYVGPTMRVDIKTVGSVRSERSNKLRVVVNEIGK